MSRTFIVGIMGVVATGCLLEPLESGEAGILGGQRETAYNAVGLVSVEGHRCTGTLVADRIMVTSKACLREGLDPRSLSFLVDTASPGFGAHGLQLFYDGVLPAEISERMEYAADDVVAVVLDHSPATPMPFTRLELALSMAGENVLEVGYGSDSLAFQKTASAATIEGVGTFMPLVATDDGAAVLCPADRGGPLLHQGTMVGVLSAAWARHPRKSGAPPSDCSDGLGMYNQIGHYAHLIDGAMQWAATHWADELPPLPSEYYNGQPPIPVNPRQPEPQPRPEP